MLLQMFNLDLKNIRTDIPHRIWTCTYNFSLFACSSKKNTFFKFW